MSEASSSRRLFLVFTTWSMAATLAYAEEPDAKAIQFYEEKVRPIFVEHCYDCHSVRAEMAKKQKGPLQLDSATGMLTYVVPGKPEKSLILLSMRHAPDVRKMPPKGKLPANLTDDVEKWIRLGAPMPAPKSTTPGKGKTTQKLSPLNVLPVLVTSESSATHPWQDSLMFRARRERFTPRGRRSPTRAFR